MALPDTCADSRAEERNSWVRFPCVDHGSEKGAAGIRICAGFATKCAHLETPLRSKDPDETDTGTSTGHWEGKTLVVETVGINPKAKFPHALTSGAIPIGKNVKITERISLNGENLDFSVLIFAPDILTAPYQRKFSCRRVAGKYMAQEMPTCKENDRAFDAATGTQRFDMTPPADLPPPPRQ